MISRPQSSPIVEFLGVDAGAGGPFALLGLTHEISTQEQIVAACNRRLYQIDRHRHRSTPDADEVRLAVHTAASQLLNPTLRQELSARWPAGKPAALPQAWKSRSTTPIAAGFIANARLLIAASGGWNATARKRLAHFARVNRVAAVDLVRAISPPPAAIAPSPINLRPSPRPNPRPNKEREHLIDPPTKAQLNGALVYTSVCALAVLLVFTVWVVESRVGSQADLSAKVTTNAVDSTGVRIDQPREPVPASSQYSDRSHYTAIAHELDQLVARAEHDPLGSVERFEALYPRFVESWVRFPYPALERSVMHVSELARRIAADPELNQRLVAIFACNQSPRDPASSMIQSAMIDVVLASSALPSDLAARIGAAGFQCSGFEPRPSLSLGQALIRVAGLTGVDTQREDSQWWARWVEGVVAATSQDEAQRTRVILSALTARLRDHSKPTKQWEKSSILLIKELSWREDSPARYWLLRQFADQEVSTPRLAVVTDALAMHSGAKQIDSQMILNPSSTFAQRQKLAKAYRTAWSVGSQSSVGGGEGEYARLINELRIRVSITPERMDQPQAITAAVELARLNAAAWQFAFGQSDQAQELLESAGDSLAPLVPAFDHPFVKSQKDTQWAQDAINTKEPGELRALVDTLDHAAGPGANSAHALVYIASLNANADLRSIASAQVVRLKAHPTILVALDHAISANRISARLEALVSSVLNTPLPPRTDSHWYRVAHEHFLVLTAQAMAQTIESDLAMLEQELARVYALGLPLVESSTVIQSNAIEIARMRFDQLAKDLLSSDQLTPEFENQIESISSLTAIRVARAQSPAQLFLAYQGGLCRLLAIRVDITVPGASFVIKDILYKYGRNQEQAKSALDQIVQTERCMAQLWTIWLEGGKP